MKRVFQKPKIKSLGLALFFPLSIVGYQCIAFLLILLPTESNIASIIFRAFVIFFGTYLLVRYKLKGLKNFNMYMPLCIFFFLYILRTFENGYLRQLDLYVPIEFILLIFFGTILAPIFIMTRAVHRIDDQSFKNANLIMMVILFLGMILNFNLILPMLEGRNNDTVVQELNPISFSSVATYFLLFLIAVGKMNRAENIIRMISIMILLGIVAITRSRGPLLALILALMIYFFFVSGQYKKYFIYLILLSIILVPLASLFFGIDFFGIAFERFFGEGTFSLNANLAEGTGRIGQWTASWNQFLESPFAGNLIFETYHNFYPHNIILEALISVGLFGFLFLGIHLVLVWKGTISLMRDKHSTIVDRFSAILCIKMFFEAQFSGAIWGAPFWIVTACILQLAYFKRLRSPPYPYLHLARPMALSK